MIQIEKPSFKKIIMTIGNLPSSYVESLSYYECMLWLCNYLENTVVPAVNNNGEAVEELQSAYEQLQKFISDYFENLDVQEEINNKLDEMAEDGTLTDLIKNYVDPIYEAYESEINERINDQDSDILGFKNVVNASLNSMSEEIQSVASGSPLVASSTSEMTDTTRVYVNTTDGNWYYYDGDSWEIGGVYQATDINDNSINVNKLNTKVRKDIGYNPIEYTGTDFKLGVAIHNTGYDYNQDTITRFSTGLLSLNYIEITAIGSYEYNIYKYNKTDGSFISAEGWKSLSDVFYNCDDSYLYKVSIRIDDVQTVSSSDLENVIIKDYHVQENISLFNFDTNTKNAFKINKVSYTWEIGTINSSGSNADNTKRLRTIEYKQFDSNIFIKNNPIFNLWVFDYNSDKTFNSRKLYTNYNSFVVNVTKDHYYKFVLYKNETYEMQISDSSNVNITGYYVDKSNEYLQAMDNLLLTFNSHGFNTGSYASGITMVKDYLVEFGISDDLHQNYSYCNLYKINVESKKVDYVKTILHNFGHVNSVDYCVANDSLVFGNGSGDFSLKGKFYVYENFYNDLISNTQLEITDAIEYDCENYDIGNEYKFNCCWCDGNAGKYDTIILVTNNYRNIRKIQLGRSTNQLELGVYNSGATNFNGTFKIIKEYTQTTGSATGTDNTYAVQDLSYFDNKLYGGVGHNLNMYWIMKLNDDGTITRSEQKIDITNNSGVYQELSVSNIYVNRNYLLCNMGSYLLFNK